MFRRTFTILVIFTLTPLLALTTAYYFYQVYVTNRNFSADLVQKLGDTNYLIAKIVEDKKSDVLSWSHMNIPAVCFEYERPEAMEMFLDKMKDTYHEFMHIVAYTPNNSVFALDSASAQDPNSLPNWTTIPFDKANAMVSLSSNQVRNYLIVTAPINDKMGNLLGFISAFRGL